MTAITLQSWLAQAKESYNRQAPALALLFSPDGSSSILSQLSLALQDSPDQPTSYQPSIRSAVPESRPFADLLAAYAVYARDADPFSDDPDELGMAADMLQECFKCCERLFSMGDTGWLVPTLRVFAVAMVNVSLKAGRVAGDPKLTKAGEAARALGRPMGVAAQDRSPKSPSKRDAVYFLANCTFKVYFAMRNLRLCDTMLANIQNSIASGGKANYTTADQVAFSYYKGRIFLYQRRLPQARAELSKAFALCQADAWGNGRLILTYLIVASLPLGYFPSEELLAEFDLGEQYENLLPALQLGDFVTVSAELDRWGDWHRRLGNYLLLKEKLEVVCWRNLIRRTLFVTTNGSPLPEKGPPTLSLHAVLTAARIAFADDTLDIDDVEAMCASLMEQGYIKAYIMHSKRLLVLQKGPAVGFPPVAGVNP